MKEDKKEWLTEKKRLIIDIVLFVIILTTIIYAQTLGIYEKDHITIDCTGQITELNEQNYNEYNITLEEYQNAEQRNLDGTRNRKPPQQKVRMV